jgi:hypothetical protein
MSEGKIVAFPRKTPIRNLVHREMTEDQRQWYWAGRIDSLIEAMGHTPTWQSSAGKRPGAAGGPAEIVTLPRKRKPKPAG